MVLSYLFSTSSVKFTSNDKTELDNYKYQGGDNGITYKYFHSPLAELVASVMPMSLAPNVITLIAALCLVGPHIMTIVLYGQSFRGPVGDYAALIVGIFHMIYITLDNVDGKQARRTGSSSPLGQMFDHGCDAITFNLAVITLCRYQQMPADWILFALVTLGPTGYFMYNLKEYYMGEYYLPIINPVSEGSLLSFTVGFLCFWFGWERIQQEYAYGLTALQIYSLFMVISQVYQNIEMMIEIVNAKTYEMKFDMLNYFINLSSYFLVLGLSIVIIIISPNDLMHDETEGGRCIMYILLFGNSYLVLHLMIGHLCK